jgi:uncharacterized protein with PIN domain
MVRLLRKGARPADAPLRATCTNCHSLFEFTQEEARVEPDVGESAALAVKCPGCHQEIWLIGVSSEVAEAIAPAGVA